VLADDVRYVDHRLANLGVVEGVPDFIRHLSTLTEIIPDLSMRAVAVEAIAPDRAVFMAEVTGTNSEGGHIEFVSYVFGRSLDGRATHVEEFPLEQRDAVLERFGEFGRSAIDRPT
jgi:hypothetical protein